MPTRGRQAFATRALCCYLSQTWEEKQLIVLDDADSRSFPDGLYLPGVDYHLLESRFTIGQKRNAACLKATGSMIAHFDDDDWSDADRLEEQVIRLSNSGKNVCGYHSMWFTDSSKWWKYSGSEDYALGTSLVYHRSYWEQHHFQETCDQGEDNHFIWPARRTGDITSIDAELRLIATIHPGNTSIRKIHTAQWSQHNETQPRM